MRIFALLVFLGTSLLGQSSPASTLSPASEIVLLRLQVEVYRRYALQAQAQLDLQKKQSEQIASWQAFQAGLADVEKGLGPGCKLDQESLKVTCPSPPKENEGKK